MTKRRNATMRKAIILVAAACQLAIGADATAAATGTLQETHHVDIDYAEALDELEREMGSGPHGTDHEHHQPHHHDAILQKKPGYGPRRERKALDDIAKLDEQLRNFEGKSHDDLRLHFHQRQKDKKVHLDKMHREVSERLDDHHEGRKLLSDEELEQHKKRKTALERKKRSLEEETPERYMERMERHEEKLREKLARKQRRHDERFNKLKEEL